MKTQGSQKTKENCPVRFNTHCNAKEISRSSPDFTRHIRHRRLRRTSYFKRIIDIGRTTPRSSETPKRNSSSVIPQRSS